MEEGGEKTRKKDLANDSGGGRGGKGVGWGWEKNYKKIQTNYKK